MKKKNRAKEEEGEPSQKGMELLGLLMLLMVLHVCLVCSQKPRVLLGFLPNPRILKSKLGKTLHRTRST